jgi:hypothetical protein
VPAPGVPAVGVRALSLSDDGGSRRAGGRARRSRLTDGDQRTGQTDGRADSQCDGQGEGPAGGQREDPARRRSAPGGRAR